MENLFDRAVALNQDQWVDRPGSDPSRFTGGRATLELHGKLNGLLANPIHARADKDVILTAGGRLASVLPEPTKLSGAACYHAAIWTDLDIG